MKTFKPTSKKTIAVLGANGRVSTAVAKAFNDAGWHIIAITRNGETKTLAELPNIETRAADALSANAVIEATAGADVIFNGLNSAYTEWQNKALPMAKNALRAAEAHGALHLFPGNVYNYGSSIPPVVTPETPFSPDHSKAKIRSEIEALFEESAAKGRSKSIILRAGDFFGGTEPGSWFDLAIAKDTPKGKVTLPGRRDIIHSWAYLPDLAQTFVRLAAVADELPDFSRFLFKGHAISGEDLAKAMDRVTGQSLKRASMPQWFLQTAGLFSAEMREISTMFYLWKRAHRMEDPALADTIGKVPMTPIDIAVGQALADLELLPMKTTTHGMARSAA